MPRPVARSIPDEESEDSTTNDNADNVVSSAHKRKAEDALDEPSEDESVTELGDTKEIMPSRRIYKDMPPCSAFGEMVTIQVGSGDQKRTFHAYKGLLSFYSGYFRAALSDAWTEGEIGSLRLEDEEADVVERFVFWFNMRKITDNTLGLNFDIVIRLWLSADRREITLLMNDMISCLKRIVVEQGILPIDQVGLVYERTLAGSPLRRMLIHTMSFDHAECDHWPKEALWDLTKALTASPRMIRMSKEQYKEMDICQFQVHDDGVHCPVKTRKTSKGSQ